MWENKRAGEGDSDRSEEESTGEVESGSGRQKEKKVRDTGVRETKRGGVGDRVWENETE